MGYKSLAVADYLLKQAKSFGNTLTPMQLIKLSYIAHGWMLGKYGASLLDEPVEAWQYGPVIPSIYHSVKHFRGNAVQNVLGYYPDKAEYPFSDKEKEIMAQVYQDYGKYDGLILSDATHQPKSPWSQVLKTYPARQISDDLIEHFYRNEVVNVNHNAL